MKNARAVVVGVSNYVDANVSNLYPCDSEAGLVFDRITNDEYGLFDPETSSLLTSSADADGKSTRSAILLAIQNLVELSEKDDTLLVYFSGHGTSDGGTGYLICEDTRAPMISMTAINLRELLGVISSSAAKYKIVILDCCKPGLIVGKSQEAMSSDFQDSIESISDTGDEGIVVLASCKADQYSYLMDGDTRSVFTHYLLEALEGFESYSASGQIIPIDAIFAHVTNCVRDWSLKNHKLQVPQMSSQITGSLSDIALAKVPEDGGKVPAKDDTEPPTKANWVCSQIALQGRKTLHIPTELEPLERDTSPYDTPAWDQAIYIMAPQQRRKTRVIESERSRVYRDADSEMEEMLGAFGALAAELDGVDGVNIFESNRIDFLRGHVYASRASEHWTELVNYKLEYQWDQLNFETVNSFFKKFLWRSIDVTVESERSVQLGSITSYAIGQKWKISSYMPQRFVELKVPGIGQRSGESNIHVEVTDRENTEYLFRINVGSSGAREEIDDYVDFVVELIEQISDAN